MTSSVTIQKIEIKDSAAVGEVYYKTWLATYPNKEVGVTEDDVEYKFKDSHLADGTRYANIPDNQLVLTAKDGTSVIGVCRLFRNDNENELKSIYVLPEYQGKGIGKMFWSEALKFFDPSKSTIVKVVSYNKNAIEFYRKLGFKDTDKIFYDEHFKMKSGVIPPETEMIIPAGKIF